MATEKERELMREIMDLALDIGAGEYDVSFDFSGHINGLSLRIAKKGSNDWVFYGEAIYLSGRNEFWDEKQSVELLTKYLSEVKKYHKDYDADGIRLELAK